MDELSIEQKKTLFRTALIQMYRQNPNGYTAKVAFLACAQHGYEVPPDVMAEICDVLELQVQRSRKDQKSTKEGSHIGTVLHILPLIDERIKNGEDAGLVYRKYAKELGYGHSDNVPLDDKSVARKIKRLKNKWYEIMSGDH